MLLALVYGGGGGCKMEEQENQGGRNASQQSINLEEMQGKREVGRVVT